MQTSNFDFHLPEELIAQVPLPCRDDSRLLVLDRASADIVHRRFRDLLDYLRAGDVLVLNNSRVIPARLRGVNARSGGEFEILLLEEKNRNDWWCLLRPGKRARVGTQILLRAKAKGSVLSIVNSHPIRATVTEINDEGHRRLRFDCDQDIKSKLDELGEVPLPPYIQRASTDGLEADRQRYQTVFAEDPGSVAAPTAGLHFTEALLEKIRALGVYVCSVTLHVGLGTFAPVKVERLSEHKMHEERFEISPSTARLINEAKRSGHRVIAVGTTTLRVLETVAAGSLIQQSPDSTAQQSTDSTVQRFNDSTAQQSLDSTIQRFNDSTLPGQSTDSTGQQSTDSTAQQSLDSTVQRFNDSTLPGVSPSAGRTNIFIYPPHPFKVVDALLTNFHLPRSTLLMLVCAFAAPGETRGRSLILSAYSVAIKERYRFFSYGDAMLIL